MRQDRDRTVQLVATEGPTHGGLHAEHREIVFGREISKGELGLLGRRQAEKDREVGGEVSENILLASNIQIFLIGNPRGPRRLGLLSE